MSRHSTGITIALAVAFAIGLSFAPLPEAWRPLPGLRDAPLQTALAAVLPDRTAPLKRQDAITGAPLVANADPQADALPSDEEETPLPDEPAEPLPGGPLPPAATLGAAEARGVRRLERWIEKVGAKHVDIEQPCRAQDEAGGCRGWALDPFFERLEALQRGEGARPVRIVHLGDSQIASDHITDLIRRRLELRYGSGGQGFLFVDRPTRQAGRKVRTGEATDGWEVVKLTDKDRQGILGFSGVRFVSRGAPQKTLFNVAAARTAELFFVTSPRGGVLDVRADDAKVSNVLTRFLDSELAFSRVRIPSGATTLTLGAGDGEVNLLGVALETGEPGVVYDSVGLPGALFEVYLRSAEKVFAAQLARRDPALVVVMLGGNEAYEIGRGWQTLEDARGNARQLVDRIQKAAPGASCLLIAPMDAGVRTVSGEIEPRPNTAEVGKMIREVALEKGCGFWNLLEAMGGIRSVPRWLEAGLFNQDLVHPRATGADALGHLFDFALERARTARQEARNLRFVEAAGLVDSSGQALARTFEKLRALQKAKAEAPSLRVVQLGASHTASHMFTDVVRAELGRRFGTAGRGFVAAGRPSPRLLPDVRRELEGDWEIPDAREGGPNEPWGLTGIRAVGQPGAKLRIRFGEQKSGREAPATLSLHYLETPGMGRLAVRIDGKPVAELGASGTAGDTQARVASFPVQGTSHVLEVENLGPGPTTLFGAAVDQPSGGVIWDALGLPGTTVMHADGYARDVFEAQLQARAADLYVLFFGTNESALADFDPERVRQHNRSLLQTLRRASPNAECLVLGPTDRVRRTPEGSWEEEPHLEATIRVLREVAAEEGCAFWSARAAMGGPRALLRWASVYPPLALEDGIHLTARGYEALAHSLVDALLGGYR